MTSGERVICMSNRVRESVQTHYPRVPAERLQVIPRGVDVAQFPRAGRQARRARLAPARIPTRRSRPSDRRRRPATLSYCNLTLPPPSSP
ncbi:glycosyltransferase, partial [Leclercia adecarboxylata]|uniref:glycosyltransferase n=1 Tax=Leclercia adecarboxylata TaxID=83655 RepID=UPI0036F35DC2